MKVKSESEVTQLCPTVCDPMDYSQPGSSTRGIFQARVLEWGTIAFSGFSKNLAQLERIPHTEYLINLSSPIMCQVVSGHPGLSFKRILSAWFSQNPPPAPPLVQLMF